MIVEPNQADREFAESAVQLVVDLMPDQVSARDAVAELVAKYRVANAEAKP